MTTREYKAMPMTQEYASDHTARGIEIGGEAFVVRGNPLPMSHLLVASDEAARISLVKIMSWPKPTETIIKPWVALGYQDSEGNVRFHEPNPREERTRTIVSVPEMGELLSWIGVEMPEDHRQVAFDQEIRGQAAHLIAGIVADRFLADPRLPGGALIAK